MMAQARPAARSRSAVSGRSGDVVGSNATAYDAATAVRKGAGEGRTFQGVWWWQLTVVAVARGGVGLTAEKPPDVPLPLLEAGRPYRLQHVGGRLRRGGAVRPGLEALLEHTRLALRPCGSRLDEAFIWLTWRGTAGWTTSAVIMYDKKRVENSAPRASRCVVGPLYTCSCGGFGDCHASNGHENTSIIQDIWI